MFLSTMTNEEIRQEALEDFHEIKWKIQCMAERFLKNSKIRGWRMGYFLGQTMEKHQLETKNHNRWEIVLYNQGLVFKAHYCVLPLIYSSYTNRNGQTNYLFLANIQNFKLFLLSPHFLKRYRERYIEPNNIKINPNLNLACHFMLYNKDCYRTDYRPKEWNDTDWKHHSVWLSEHGLMIVRSKDRFLRMITFLDQENLSAYKAQVYEEEKIFKEFSKLEKYMDIRPDDPAAYKEKQAAMMRIVHYPDAKEKLANYFKRNALRNGHDLKQVEKVVKILNEAFDDILRLTDEIEEKCRADANLNSLKENRENVRKLANTFNTNIELFDRIKSQ